MRFSGSVVLVAGGTGGLGRAVSLALLQEDARVVVTYRNEDEFIALRSAAGSNGSLLEGRRVDVTEEASVAQLVDGVLAEYGQLDAVVNTVGGLCWRRKVLGREHESLRPDADAESSARFLVVACCDSGDAQKGTRRDCKCCIKGCV